MKANLMLIIFAFTCTSLNAQWNLIQEDDVTVQLAGVSFVNADTGFVIGTKSTSWTLIDFFQDSVPSEPVGMIMRTNDGGISWDTTCYSNFNDFSSVFFLNEREGWILGHANNDSINLLKTIDGGDTWNFIKRAVPENCWEYSNKIYFLNSNVGFLVGYFLFRTVDGGNSWYVIETNNQILKDIDFPSPGTGFLGSGCSSSDSGSTWNSNPAQLPEHMLYTSVGFHNDLFGYIAYNLNLPNVSGGGISRTTSGGLDWSVCLKNDQIGNIFSIYNHNDSVAYFIGSEIIKTNNQGLSFGFQVTDSYISSALEGISFPTDSIGYIVGYDGSIYKTYNAGGECLPIVNIPSIEMEDVTIFPNPCCDFFIVECPSCHNPHRLELSEVSGRIILVSHNASRIDVHSLKTGIYWLKIFFGDCMLTRKLVIQK